MNTFETFLWVALPWIAAACLVVGIIWRWRTDQFGWTSRSTQIYESKLLRLSSPLFHFGIIFVFLGHLLGLAVPKSWTRQFGVTDEAYHLLATIPGTIAGAMTVLGLLGLLYRRIVKRSVRLATSTSDIWMYVILTTAIFSGMIATVSTQVLGGPHGYDYRETISPWLRGTFSFNAQPELMADVPWQFKVHVVAGLTILAILPFTRLVHAFSAPVAYPTRPYVVYRSRDTRTTSARHDQWEHVAARRPEPAELTGDAQLRAAPATRADGTR